MAIIGITGTDGSGKGAVAEYLVAEKGFAHISARALLLEEIERRGLEATRANMRAVGNDLRARHGNAYIVDTCLARIRESGCRNAVIESIRTTAEADTLKEASGVLLAVDADQKLRYERIQERRSESDRVSFEEFKRHEALEMDDADPHGMQKRKVMAMADYTVENNGTLEELHGQIERVLALMRG